MLEEGQAVLQQLQQMAGLSPPQDPGGSPSSQAPYWELLGVPQSPARAASRSPGRAVTPPQSPKGLSAASAHIKRIAGLRSAKAADASSSVPPAAAPTPPLTPNSDRIPSSTSSSPNPSPSPTGTSSCFLQSPKGNRRLRFGSAKRPATTSTSFAAGLSQSIAVTGQQLKTPPPPATAVSTFGSPVGQTDGLDPSAASNPVSCMVAQDPAAEVTAAATAVPPASPPLASPASSSPSSPRSSPLASLAGPGLSSPPASPAASPPDSPQGTTPSPDDALLSRQVSTRTFFLAVNDSFPSDPRNRVDQRSTSSRVLRAPFAQGSPSCSSYQCG
eukprot:EG_transcript_4710